MRRSALLLLVPAVVATPSAAGAQTQELTEIKIVARRPAGAARN